MTATSAEDTPEPRKYMRVAEQIRTDIIKGRLPIGARLPAEHELARRFKVAKLTLRRALDVLRIEGYLKTAPGIGTYVESAEPSDADPGTVNPDVHDAVTIMMFEDIRDALERLEAHIHRTVRPPTR